MTRGSSIPLFCIAMEYVSLKLEDNFSQSTLKPISTTQPCISHLLYADDVMFFLKASVQNDEEMQKFFGAFEITTGLQVNQVKSKVYFSRQCINKQLILQIPAMTESMLPVKYLGVPLSLDYINAAQCQPPLQQLTTKLDS